MRKWENIIVHISASPWGCAREIRRWHMAKGWRDGGYHFVVLNGLILQGFMIPCLEGSIEALRELDGDPFVEDNEVGAHALGYNDKSIGICGIGDDKWFPKQKDCMVQLVRELQVIFNIETENILGHYETASGKAQGKTCPNLDMDEIRRLIDE